MSDKSDDLRVRVERLEAVEELRRLQQTYAAYCDEGYPPEKIVPLFVDDGEIDAGPFGKCSGKEEIFDFYALQGKNISWALHYLIADSLHIDDDGDTASGSWYVLSPLSTDLGGGTSASWFMGRYRDTYKKVDGEWKFDKRKFTVDVAVPAAQGWHPERIAVG